MSLPCWVKWVVSFISGPALLAVGVVLAIIVVFGGLLLFLLGGEQFFKRVIPDKERRTHLRVLWFGSDYGPFHEGILGKTMLGIMLAAFVVFGSTGFMQSVYGCNECLPAFMRDSCKAAESAAAQEKRDREEFERLCGAYPEWCGRGGL